jgi:hypothetical protein
LHLTPKQLGRLTHGEFLDLYDGFKWRDKRATEHFAQLASWTTAPHLKRPIDPKKLMQEKKPKKKTTPEKTAAIVSELEKLMGVS